MTSTLGALRRRIRVDYTAKPKKGSASIVVRRPGACAVCPATWSLTKHHVFGSGSELTIVLCRNCHDMVHRELQGGAAGPFCRHVFQILAQCFPATAPLPEWLADEGQ